MLFSSEILQVLGLLANKLDSIMSRIYLSPPDVSAKDHLAIEGALNSGWIAPVGPDLEAFEASVAQRLGRKYALAVNSGTAALHLALLALDLKPKDRVICPSLTFAGCAFPIRYCGAEPVFVDSELDTWNVDPELLEAAIEALIKEGTPPKAVIVVQIYGQCAQMDRISAICQRYELTLIEDAAESLGASYKGQCAGSFGEVSFLSFNGNKIITSSGGGMLLTDNKALVEKARCLANQAREPVLHYEHAAVGYNYRLSNLLAALGRSQLEDLDHKISQRKEHYCAYVDALGSIDGVRFMPISKDGEANYWLTICLIDGSQTKSSRDQIIALCAAENIEVRPTWKPLHLQPVFSSCKVFGGAVSEDLFKSGLCLPSGSNLPVKSRDRIIHLLKSALMEGCA